MIELPWIAEARNYVGIRENTSKGEHSPLILSMLERMGHFSDESPAWWKDDETPWCGLFVGFCLGITGRYVVREWYRAGAWQSYHMTKLDQPAYGCIATFTRNGGGHVGFVVGTDEHDHVMILGGNQSNAVNVLPFPVSRLVGCYWPSEWKNKSAVKRQPAPVRYQLPLLQSNGQPSSNES